MSTPQRFTDDLLRRPDTGDIDVVTKLQHFAIITYAVPPERIRPHVHERFALDTYTGSDGKPVVWLSVVPFVDVDFHFARLPWFNFHFGQTNYRTYVIDQITGEPAVWFFGTLLAGWPVIVPRYLWQLPWHYGQMQFDVVYDNDQHHYTCYRMTSTDQWAAAEVELEDSGTAITTLDGFPDLEAGLVKLTHPLIGVYYRRDGVLGSYRIWHDRLECTAGRIKRARFDLLDRLNLVPFAEQQTPHSVLIQPETEFIVHLPPKRI